MKKKYSKPDIIFESFSLSTAITAGCEVKLETPEEGVCGVKFGKVYVFTEEITGCVRKIVDGSSSYDGLCYHLPESINNLFNS